MATISLTQELYCLVPADLEHEALEPLRDALSPLGIAVIVERRTDGPVPYSVARQRAMHLPRELPELPTALVGYADRLKLVQRMPPAGVALADLDLMEVAAAAADGDGPAASELIFRMSGRMHSRLQSRHGREAAQDIEAVLGRMLDRIDAFDGDGSGALYRWLDALVDDR